MENRRILVIDDNRSIHDSFRKLLGDNAIDTSSLDSKEAIMFGESSVPPKLSRYCIDSAYQGEEALAMIHKARMDGQPYMMAFVDVRMPPGLDGIETIDRAKCIDPEIQFVLCTAYSDYSLQEVVQRLGETDRLLFLRKPFEAMAAHLLAIAMTEKWHLNREVAGVVDRQKDCIVDLERVIKLIEDENAGLVSSNVSLETQSDELSRRLQERTVEILGTRNVTFFALAQLAESRDPETGDHLMRMREYAQLLATRLSQDSPYAEKINDEFLDNFYCSTPLHDIGKVGIPDHILLKPGALTSQEFDIMKRHTLIGAEALEKSSGQSPYGCFLHMAASIARSHHEKFDGRGYPIGMSGQQIPLAARIAAVADVFDALTMDRVYRDAMSVDQAKQIIVKDKGTHFDPVVVDAFIDCYEGFKEIKMAIDGSVDKSLQSLA